MRKIILAVVVLPFAASFALAQLASPPPGPNTTSSSTPGSDAAAPVPIPGGNSSVPSTNSPAALMNPLTESDVRARLAHNGFVNMSGFQKGEDGIWRGVAEKNSVSTPVMVDANGIIMTRN